MTTPQPRLPTIPEYITVHLGRPTTSAKNVQVPFKDYIKNVASSEIYPTWPENAIRANVYAQISFALNRMYTEWYRSKGYDFDITNSTQFDQAFNPGRDIFGNISTIVDEVFNDYVVKQGSVEPYFTEFCNGTTAICNGLSQWGTVDLAKRGYTPYEILKYYYGNNINIIFNAPVENTDESYSGIPLKLGTVGNDVLTIQQQLNRIGRNYPAITRIPDPDSIFGVITEAAVKDFQGIFNLPVTGVVDKATWYQIKNIYNSVKKLGELTSEGISAIEATPIYAEELSFGMEGPEIRILQYYLNFFSYFNPAISSAGASGVFDEQTLDSVKSFQQEYGVAVTGVVYRATWGRILTLYREILMSLKPGYQGVGAKIYPGYFLEYGMENSDVSDLQEYLRFIAGFYSDIPTPAVTGYFGEQTKAAVEAFQRRVGLAPTGVVGPVTWFRLANAYNELKGIS